MGRIYGLDVSAPITAAQWDCVFARGARFAVVRAYRDARGGEPDDGCPGSAAGAWAAGFTQVDVYHFPVQRTKTAAAQAGETLGFLAAHGVKFGRLWLDVEGAIDGATWWPDPDDNLRFIGEFVAAVAAAGATAGIYCSTAGWTTIAGGRTDHGDLPLWWSSHGKEFTPFGGWSAPTMVQYAYDTAHCGIVYDSDYLDG